MASFFQGFDDEDASWNVPNWMNGNNSRDSSFSSLSCNHQKDATTNNVRKGNTAPPPPTTPQSRQDIVEDVGIVRAKDDAECSRTDDESGGEDSSLEEEREIFQKAREYLHPSRFFRSIIGLYAQRKMNVFFLIHFMCTMVIWAHFALIKWEEQADAVPVGAHRYWLKRIAPALEFGT